MKIELNGQPIEVIENVDLLYVLEIKNMASKTGIAVAVNGSVVQKNNWKTYKLNNNDKIMIITATAGG